ncbi:MAG TPA: hypothetical protein DD435_12595 [Cyanobacteria bacterium UBA8530]|nr:hypothetical protein [Cyanobacteria bacterium UBA8530]
MNEETVLYACEDGIATVTINRPRAFNAINREVVAAFNAILDKLPESDPRVLILTGAGEKAFIAGADIEEMENMDPIEAVDYSASCHRLLDRLSSLPIPVIAAVNGFALGGGLEFALACDVRISADNGVFGFPEVTLGIIPGWGGTQRLPRLIGQGRALELLFTGKRIKADEAASLGIVNQIVPKGEALNGALLFARGISRARTAVANVKKAATMGLRCGLDTGLSLEAGCFGNCFAHPDQKEGMAAFKEKREARFEEKSLKKKGCHVS